MQLSTHCGIYIPLSDDEHRFVQKVHPAHANGHWKRGCNSNPVATLPHAAVVLYTTIQFYISIVKDYELEF